MHLSRVRSPPQLEKLDGVQGAHGRPRGPAHMGHSFGSACAASSTSYGASCLAAGHPLADALDKDMRDSVREWDCSNQAGNDAAAGDEHGSAPGQAPGNAKSVSFNLPHESERHHEVLDRSAGGASVASNASTASWSSSSTRSDSSWVVYGGISARRRPEDILHCPGCGKQTLDEHGGAGMVRFLSSSLLPAQPAAPAGVVLVRMELICDPSREQSASVCYNGGWKWKGEPPFCCLCASFKGLGRLSRLGCSGCKSRRTHFYKRTSWLNHTCKHCQQPKASHTGNGAYPRCYGAASQSPAPNTSQHVMGELPFAVATGCEHRRR